MTKPRVPPGKDAAGRRRTVRVRLSEEDLSLLESLAAYHRLSVEALLSGGLPRIFEKYEVLRRLGERGRRGPGLRRCFVTGTSPKRHDFALRGSQPRKEEESG